MITIDLRQFKQSLRDKKEAFQAAARPAAQAGVQVIYDEARLNVPVSEATHFFYGKSYKTTGRKYGPYSPGNLRDSIYQVYSEKNSGPGKATYHVSWNGKKAPYAWMVEFGTSRAPAHPFMGPAIANKKDQVLLAMKAKFVQEVQG